MKKCPEHDSSELLNKAKQYCLKTLGCRDDRKRIINSIDADDKHLHDLCSCYRDRTGEEWESTLIVRLTVQIALSVHQLNFDKPEAKTEYLNTRNESIGPLQRYLDAAKHLIEAAELLRLPPWFYVYRDDSALMPNGTSISSPADVFSPPILLPHEDLASHPPESQQQLFERYQAAQAYLFLQSESIREHLPHGGSLNKDYVAVKLTMAGLEDDLGSFSTWKNQIQSRNQLLVRILKFAGLDLEARDIGKALGG